MKRNIYHIWSIASVSLLLSACADFKDLNTNPLGVSDVELSQDNSFIGSHFPAIQQSIYFNFNTGNGADYMFQTFQNLNADIWSGYMASPSNFRGGVNDQTLVLVPGWDDSCWNETYNHLMPNSQRIKEKAEELGYDTYGHFDAINTILRVFGMSRMVDQYGPIIYSKYGESLLGGTYDAAQDVYQVFFDELDSSVKELDKILNTKVASFGNFDMSYKGDYSKWMKLGNSLRLRLAMRIVKYDSNLARQQAEAAIKAPQGVMTTNADNFTVSGFGYRNPLATLSGRSEWNDVHINANIVSILGGYKDNRLSKFALASPAADRIIGVRSGIPDLDKLETQYKAILANVNITSPDIPVILFTAAETYFLLAEAALRGWNTGGETAQSYYEKGITTSFEQWGAALGDYLESSNTPAPFVDGLREDFNAPAMSQVTPRWVDAKTDEERLEKICTQRWIAVFPEGMNGWAIVRRTGYPKLFPVLKNDSQGIIPTALGVRRLAYTQGEKMNNLTGVADAIKLLGGPDNGATRIFWDIDKPNF